VQGEWHSQDANQATKLMAYAFHYNLDLFSDFTYYLESPQGDQFEQEDQRNVIGLKASHTIFGKLAGDDMENTFGAQFQNSWIDTGLYSTVDDVRTDKVDYLGNPIPAVTKVDNMTETSLGLYYDNKIQWAEKFRSEFGLREDIYDVNVLDENPANSGHHLAALPSPKLSLIFGPWDNTEFYVQAGYGFHSNDARATTSTVNPDGSAGGTDLPVLVQARGGEVGVRTSLVPHLQSTLAVWYLHNNSELYFDGIDADSGDTTASEQATNRYGVEWANYYTPFKGVTFDVDLADSWAYFVSPTTAAEDITPGGTLVDEAIHESASAGITLHQDNGWSESLRARFFGPRPLDSTGSVESSSTFIVNAQVAYKVNDTWEVSLEALNLLDRKDHDIDYYYQSQVTPASVPTNQIHFHPVEPIQLRVALTARF
jgi:outer membrane receptor protein involved in Fe transport